MQVQTIPLSLCSWWPVAFRHGLTSAEEREDAAEKVNKEGARSEEGGRDEG